MNIPNLAHLRTQPADELHQARRELLRLIPGLQRAESAIGRELRRRARAEKKRQAHAALSAQGSAQGHA